MFAVKDYDFWSERFNKEGKNRWWVNVTNLPNAVLCPPFVDDDGVVWFGLVDTDTTCTLSLLDPFQQFHYAPESQPMISAAYFAAVGARNCCNWISSLHRFGKGAPGGLWRLGEDTYKFLGFDINEP